MQEPEINDDLFDLGHWLGSRQAFAAVAGRCSAADAECLRTIRSKKLYRACGLNWDDFCRAYVGISRSRADELIRQLEEFGAGYFHLAEVARITPESFRLIAPAVSEKGVMVGGETIAFTAENSRKLARAVEQLCARAQAERPQPAPRDPAHRFARVKKTLAAALAELEGLGALSSEAMERQPYYALLDETICRLTRLNTGHLPGVE